MNVQTVKQLRCILINLCTDARHFLGKPHRYRLKQTLRISKNTGFALQLHSPHKTISLQKRSLKDVCKALCD